MGIMMSPLKVHLTIALVVLLSAACMGDGSMHIFVRDLNNGKIWTLYVKPTDTIESLKQMIQAKNGMSIHQMELIYHSWLRDRLTIAEYNIHKGSTIFLDYTPTISIG